MVVSSLLPFFAETPRSATWRGIRWPGGTGINVETGNLEIVGDDVRIWGTAPATTILDANGLDRAFRVVLLAKLEIHNLDLGAFEHGALPADLIFADEFEPGDMRYW